MTQLAHKNVLITGGARGIGRLMALKTVQAGGRVVIWDRDRQRLETVAAEIGAAGSRAHIYPCDVSQRTQVYARAREVKAAVGKIDILINNAGVVSGKLFLECSDEQIEQTIRVNLMAPIWTTRAFLPDMIAAGQGHLVAIASAAALVGVAGLADYAASKFGLLGWDESLRAELKSQNLDIRTTVVCPYYINTGMFRGVRTRFKRLLPILDEEVVARRIIAAIQRNQARLLLPRIVYLLSPLRLLPIPLFDRLIDFFGVHHGMDRYQGRGDP